jgi:Fe-S-cluster formation regulator IscX/YfhJ
MAVSIDLEMTKKRVAVEARQDPVPDVIGYVDFFHDWTSHREELGRCLDDDKYRPGRPEIIEVSKTSLLSRPITRLPMIDRLYYEALVDTLSPDIDETLPPNVFSARLADIRHYSSPRQRGTKAWKRFNKASLSLSARYEDAFILSTDITSYYEYVHLPDLFADLERIASIDRAHIARLKRFLYGLQEHPPLWGLPQHHTASAVLSNLYLLPVDALIGRTPGVEHVRYGDDIRVFGNDTATLRRCLRDCITLLRTRHLNVAVHKTRIVTSSELESELRDWRKDAILYGMDAGSSDAAEDLRDLFDEAVDPARLNERDIRFSVYRLQQLGDDHAVPWILRNLHEAPFLAELLVPYLAELYHVRVDIESAIVDFLGDEARNIYPHLEQQVMRMLSQARSIGDEAYQAAWSVLVDEQKPHYVRAFASRCVARHMRAGDEASLLEKFGAASTFELRRALLIALHEARSAPKSLLKSTAVSDPQLRGVCDYLIGTRSLPRP